MGFDSKASADNRITRRPSVPSRYVLFHHKTSTSVLHYESNLTLRPDVITFVLCLLLAINIL